jgi:hypothetical protein
MPAQLYPYQAKRRVKALRSGYPVRFTAWITAGVALGLVLCCGGLLLGAWLQDYTEPLTTINQPRPRICSVDDCQSATQESPGPSAPTRLRSTRAPGERSRSVPGIGHTNYRVRGCAWGSPETNILICRLSGALVKFG